MADSLRDIVALGVGFCEELVRFALGCKLLGLFGDLEEFLALFNGLIEITLHFVNETELLMALGNFLFQVLLNRNRQTLVEELLGKFK